MYDIGTIKKAKGFVLDPPVIEFRGSQTVKVNNGVFYSQKVKNAMELNNWFLVYSNKNNNDSSYTDAKNVLGALTKNQGNPGVVVKDPIFIVVNQALKYENWTK